MKILSCRTLDCRQNHASFTKNPRLIYRETPPQTPKSGTQKPKNVKSGSGKEQTRHPSAARVRQIREAIKKAKAEMPENVLSTRLEKGHDEEAAFKQYPKGEKLKTDVQRAEIRRRVSKILFEQDKTLAPKEQQEIKERQTNRYYEFKIGNNTLRGHVEAPHGTAPSEEIKKWCKKMGVSSHETNTAEITKETPNWMVFKRPRLHTDVNSLPKDVESSLRSEGNVYTKEDNLNALAAQRDLTKEVLKQQGNLTEDGQAKNPYLGIYLHDKVDTRGHDFEIAAKEVDGKNLLNPLLAFWIAKKIEGKIAAKNLKNVKGETPTVNVVTYPGAYSGSNALRALRNGDGTFDFKGLGENFHALQLEVSAHIRKTNQKELAEMLQELLQEFSKEFKTPEDMNHLEKDYRSAYESKLAQEKEDFFSKKYVKFGEVEIAEDQIGLDKSVLEVLNVGIGDKVKMGGHEFEVVEMRPEVKKLGKRVLINKQYEQDVGDKIVIEVSERQQKTADDAAKNAQDDSTKHGEDGESQPQQESFWKKAGKRLKFFGSLLIDGIKDIAKGVKSFFGF